MKNKIKAMLPLLAVAFMIAGCGEKSSSPISSLMSSLTPSSQTSSTAPISSSSGPVSISSSAAPSSASSSVETKKLKTAHGTGALFTEYEGFNAREAKVFDEGDTRYVLYVTNETENSDVNAFAVRKAVKTDGKFVFGEKKIILKASTDGWDKVISAPSIIKGEFKKDAETYSYLMAYQGREAGGNVCNEIGFAVSKTLDGEWTKLGNAGKVAYDKDLYGEENFGLGSPELVSLDKKGKALLFYSWGETTLSSTRVINVDFTSLTAPVIEKGYHDMVVTGLIDKGDNTIFGNAGFALTSDLTSIATARDVFPLSSTAPGHSTSVEVSKAPIAILDNVESSWSEIGTISGTNTAGDTDATSLGWDQLFSAGFVTDAYGYISDLSHPEVIYSASDEKDNYATDYKFSSFVCSYQI